MGKAGSEDVGAHSLERWGEVMQGFGPRGLGH